MFLNSYYVLLCIQDVLIFCPDYYQHTVWCSSLLPISIFLLESKHLSITPRKSKVIVNKGTRKMSCLQVRFTYVGSAVGG